MAGGDFGDGYGCGVGLAALGFVMPKLQQALIVAAWFVGVAFVTLALSGDFWLLVGDLVR